MLYIELLFIGISLSIDAFSLAISIGINKKIYKKHALYASIVGTFHFLMPILGYLLRIIINNIIVISNKILFSVVLVFIIIGIINEKDDNKTYINPLLFGFSVSLDSFMIGVSLDKSKILVASFIFSIVSYLFTFFGFKIANKILKKFSHNLKLVSISILLILLFYNIFF